MTTVSPKRPRQLPLPSVWMLLAVCLTARLLAQEPPDSKSPADDDTLQQQPQRLRVPPELLDERIDDYFGIYIDDSKVGWARATTEQTAAQGDTAATIDFAVQLMLRFNSFGKTTETRSIIKERFSLTPPHRLVEARQTTQQDGQSLELVLRPVDGLDYELSIESGRRRQSHAWPDLDHTLGDSLAVDIWCRSPRQVGDTLMAQDIDLEKMQTEVERFRISAVKQVVVDSAPVTYYEVLYHGLTSNLKGVLRYSDKGKMVSIDFSGQMELRLEPKEIAQNLDAPLDLFARFLIPSDEALGDSSRIRSMTLDVTGQDVALFRSGPGLLVERDPAGNDQVTLVTGALASPPAPATAVEIADALEATVHYPARHPAVIALANRAVGDAETEGEKVRRLVAFVSDYIEDDYAAEPLDVHYIIEQRKGDCTEHALLVTTLARAAGIPCREVTGLMYAGDDYQAFGGHAWNEVVVDGHWLPVDATWNQTDVDGTHIRIAASRDFERAKLLHGKMRIEIRKIERK